MLEKRIFVFHCHGRNNHEIAIPREEPNEIVLGWYHREYKRKADAWPLNFACIECSNYSRYEETDSILRVDEPGDYRKLADRLSSQCLWQLNFAEPPPWYQDGSIYTVAERSISEVSLIEKVRRLVAETMIDLPHRDQAARTHAELVDDLFTRIKRPARCFPYRF